MYKDYLHLQDANNYIDRYYPEGVADCIEGCLLDSILLMGKRRVVALIETYLNPWSSCYTRYIASTAAEKRELFALWDSLDHGE